MHSYLITGNDPQRRQKEIEKLLRKHKVTAQNLLSFVPDEKTKSWGIEFVREIIGFVSARTTAPGKTRAIVIEEAHILTPEAQNSFLKTLEEVPQDTIIILSASTQELFFETILSRCYIIKTQNNLPKINYQHEKTLLQKLAKAGVGEKVKFVEKVGKKREEALSFVEDQLNFLHQQLHTSQADLQLTRALLSAHQDLQSNVNPKMVLFELLLKYV